MRQWQQLSWLQGSDDQILTYRPGFHFWALVVWSPSEVRPFVKNRPKRSLLSHETENGFLILSKAKLAACLLGLGLVLNLGQLVSLNGDCDCPPRTSRSPHTSRGQNERLYRQEDSDHAQLASWSCKTVALVLSLWTSWVQSSIDRQQICNVLVALIFVNFRIRVRNFVAVPCDGHGCWQLFPLSSCKDLHVTNGSGGSRQWERTLRVCLVLQSSNPRLCRLSSNLQL